MKTIINLSLLVLFASSLFSNIFAQTDNDFWFAVPYANLDHDCGGGASPAARLVITNSDVTTDTVTVVHPYGAVFAPIQIRLTAGATYSLSLNSYLFSTTNKINSITSPYYGVVDNNALHIYSKHGANLTCSYENHPNTVSPGANNPEIWVLKGQNSLGVDFWTPFQTLTYNQKMTNYSAYSSFDIVATQTGTTTVSITLPAGKSDAVGHTAGGSFSISLQQGQTYSVAPKLVTETNVTGTTIWTIPSRLPADRLCGSHVTADKAVAITLRDDSNYKNGAYDMQGDQLVPITNMRGDTLIGRNYIAMRGQLSKTTEGNEAVFILATKNNTSIYVDALDGSDSLITPTPINAGTQATFSIPVWKSITQIKANNPVYVLHVSGFLTETSAAILPTIDGCRGSNKISFTRSIGDKKPTCDNSTTNNLLFLNILVKSDAVDSFYCTVEGIRSKLGNASWFEAVGSTGWSALKPAYKCFSNTFLPNTTITIENTLNLFHLGMLNGVSTGGGSRYGYFSNYAEEQKASVEKNFFVSLKDTFQLKITGATNVQWSPAKYIINNSIPWAPLVSIPEGDTISFTAIVTHLCQQPETLHIKVCHPYKPFANFTVSKKTVCYQSDLVFENYSMSADTFFWNFGDGSSIVKTTSMDALTHHFKNSSVEIQTYTTELIVKSTSGQVANLQKTITVYPELVANFSPKDTVTNDAITVNYKNLTSGLATNYEWKTGDVVSYNTSPTFTFTKSTPLDTVQLISLIAKNAFCADTTIGKVHLRFNIVDTISPVALFSTSVSKACTETNVTVKNTSQNALTYTWNFGDGSIPYVTTSMADISHHFINATNAVTVFNVSLIATNKVNVSKTYTTSITIYPQVLASFSTDKTSGCDSVTVQFEDKTSGEADHYKWLANNVIFSTEKNPIKKFFTTGFGDVVQTVKLVVANAMCSDSLTSYIKTYKSPEASFSTSISQGISPLNVVIENTSVGAITNNWTIKGVTSENNNPTISVNYVNSLSKVYMDTIALKVANSYGCQNSTSKVIEVYPVVTADFSFDISSGKSPLEIAFTSTSTNSTILGWKFGNSTIGSGSPISHTFVNEGTKPVDFKVTLVASNQYGTKDSITKTITVNPVCKSKSIFSTNTLNGKSPLNVACSNLSTNASSYFWFINQKAASEQKDFNHLFENSTVAPVDYDVTLITTDSYCTADTSSATITVNPSCSTIAAFSSDITSGQSPLQTSFVNQSVQATTYEWSVNDSVVSKEANLTFTFVNKGSTSVEKIVKLVTADTYCSADTALATITVQPKTVTNPTAVAILSEGQIKAYPNPAQSQVTFEYELEKAGKVTIELYTSAGQLISSTTENKPANGTQTSTLNIGNYPGSLFIAKVTYGGTVKRISIVKE